MHSLRISLAVLLQLSSHPVKYAMIEEKQSCVYSVNSCHHSMSILNMYDCKASSHTLQHSKLPPLSGAMALQALLETVECGEQDTVLKVLQIYNQERSQCFTFEDEEREERKKLAVFLIKFLEERTPAIPCQVTCLESIRSLIQGSKSCLGPSLNHGELEDAS
uniref:Uncharacterized protein n=1 Tax=Sphaerodactylus townsendi TaxID=933632 RepID=A0ACB8G275_9SAUR